MRLLTELLHCGLKLYAVLLKFRFRLGLHDCRHVRFVLYNSLYGATYEWLRYEKPFVVRAGHFHQLNELADDSRTVKVIQGRFLYAVILLAENGELL